MKTSPSPSAKRERLRQLEQTFAVEMSIEEAWLLTGFGRSTVSKYTETLHDLGVIYISGWRVTPNLMTKLFTAGSRPDVPRPRRDSEPDDPDEQIVRTPIEIRRDWSQIAIFGEYRRAA